MSIKNVSFIGLGVMGYPMAGHLKKMDTMLLFSIVQILKQKNGLKNMVVRWVRLQMKHV